MTTTTLIVVAVVLMFVVSLAVFLAAVRWSSAPDPHYEPGRAIATLNDPTSHSFRYEDSDIPAGVTLADWRRR